MVLLLDFDGQHDRMQYATSHIPGELRDRVFVLGAWREPENLKADLGSFETIGRNLAEDCRTEHNTTWSHRLLRHNLAELDRMRAPLKPILFSGN
jgi:hypothetical protein